jgi:hypothetical protein
MTSVKPFGMLVEARGEGWDVEIAKTAKIGNRRN